MCNLRCLVPQAEFKAHLVRVYDESVLEHKYGKAEQSLATLPSSAQMLDSQVQSLIDEDRIDTLLVSSGVWPSGVALRDGLVLPRPITAVLDMLREFDKASHPGRCLHVLPRMGSVVLQYNLSERAIDLVTTPTQASILLLFNNVDTVCMDDITRQLEVDTACALEALEALSAQAHPVLREVKERKDDLTLTLNADFEPLTTSVRLTIHGLRRGSLYDSKGLKGECIEVR